MVGVDEALAIVLESLEPLPAERVSLLDALGRVSSEEMVAACELPPFTNAAMDGYAFAFSALEAAGDPPRLSIGAPPRGGAPSPVAGRSGAAEIVTGAPLPPWCDTVVPVEETRREGDEVVLLAPQRPGANVRLAGEDVGRGEVALPAGTLLAPGHLALLAALGVSEVPVRQRPRVAVLSTGNELLLPGGGRGGDGVRDANSYGLAAQVLEAGGIPILLGVAPDDPGAQARFLAAASRADAVVTSGGISMGRDDYLEPALGSWGCTFLVRKVAMKPGKPFLFGLREGRPVFALPGNPGAAMVTFEQFVRPALRLLQGDPRPLRPVAEATLSEGAGEIRPKGKRREFLRCLVERRAGALSVVRLLRSGAGMLSGVAESNALLVIAEGTARLAPGETVRVQLVRGEVSERSEPGLAGVAALHRSPG